MTDDRPATVQELSFAIRAIRVEYDRLRAQLDACVGALERLRKIVPAASETDGTVIYKNHEWRELVEATKQADEALDQVRKP